MVLSTGNLDWESNDLSTSALLHKFLCNLAINGIFMVIIKYNKVFYRAMYHC